MGVHFDQGDGGLLGAAQLFCEGIKPFGVIPGLSQSSTASSGISTVTGLVASDSLCPIIRAKRRHSFGGVVADAIRRLWA